MIHAAGAALITLHLAAFDPNASTLVARPGAPMEGVHDEDWARRLPDLMPSVLACLDANPGSYAIVAQPMPDGKALTRLVFRDKSRKDCIAEGAHVKELRNVPVGDKLPGEDRTAFFRDRGCVDAKRVDAPDGHVLGWLAYPECHLNP